MPLPVPLTPKMVVSTLVFATWDAKWDIYFTHTCACTHTHMHTQIHIGQDLMELLLCSHADFQKIIIKPPCEDFRGGSTVFWLLFIIIRKETQFSLSFGVKKSLEETYFSLHPLEDVRLNKHYGPTLQKCVANICIGRQHSAFVVVSKKNNFHPR